MKALVEAVRAALTSLEHDDQSVPVLVRGQEAPQQAGPFVLIELPDSTRDRATTTLQGSGFRTVRLRVHVFYAEAPYARLDIADAVADALRPTLTVDGLPIRVPEPERREVPSAELDEQHTRLLFDLQQPY